MKSTAHVNEVSFENVLEFELHGILSGEDYDKLTPEIEKVVAE